MYVQEGADILFLDSPVDDDEIRRAVAAADGRPSFAVLSPGAPRATPSREQAEALGFKIGTYPTGLLSPAPPDHLAFKLDILMVRSIHLKEESTWRIPCMTRP